LRGVCALAMLGSACNCRVSNRMPRLSTLAPAKVNLTLAVLARRSDGFHELSSLVAFAAAGDGVALDTGSTLDLAVEGPTAAMTGPKEGNLVLKAARAAAERIEGLKSGRFHLKKELPAGAGLGGGSSDAAAALRLIAEANEISTDDDRILDAARATGADVAVCLDPCARLMHGTGDVLSTPLDLPKLDAVLVFPARPLSTADVFGNFTLVAGPRRRMRYAETEIPTGRDALMDFLRKEANDLELAARLTAPEISEAKSLLEEPGDALVVRMSGSGSAFFALYENAKLAKRAAARISKRKPKWWVRATTLG
jgi:4-diphosphocytidyl-2-C-methyl-D-erythritol kinase